MHSTPTSRTKTSKAGRRHAGFTLIEILIVLGIIAAALTMALPRLFKSDNNIKAVARQFMVLGKEVRNWARVKNVTTRLVINLDPNEPQYWVEAAKGPELIPTEMTEDEKEKAEEDGTAPQWDLVKVLTKKKKSLPGQLVFGAVETIHMKAPQTEGIAYIHFFPEGLMEAASIQITDQKNLTWTLIYNPLTGQADIIEEARSLKDVKP